MKITKVERLTNLVVALLDSRQPLSVREINEKVNGYIGLKSEAARRQLARDRKDLEEAGIEVELVNIPHTQPPRPGYKIAQQDYYLKNLNLSAEELASINLAKQLVNLGNETMDMALYKLGGAEATQVESLVWLPPLEEIHSINRAIQEKLPMRFEYLSEKGEATKRELEPLRIYALGGHWHVAGYDRSREGLRNFRIDRIQGKIKFSKADDFHPVKSIASNLNPWEYASGIAEPLTAELWIDADNATWAELQLGSSVKAAKDPAGDVIFQLQVSSPEHFYRFVASFNQSAEIRGDDALREGFREYLEGIS